MIASGSNTQGRRSSKLMLVFVIIIAVVEFTVQFSTTFLTLGFHFIFFLLMCDDRNFISPGQFYLQHSIFGGIWESWARDY